MQQKQALRQKERLKKELQKIKIGFIKQGSSLNRFCEESNIPHGYIGKLFSGRWVSGEKHDELKNRIITASKAK